MNTVTLKHKKALLFLLVCMGVLSVGLASTKAFASQPSQNTTSSSEINLLRDSDLVQTKISLTNGLFEQIIHNTNVNNLSFGLDNQEGQGAILEANETSNSIASIIINGEETNIINADDLVNAIKNASTADVYLYEDIVLNNTIETKTQSIITIHLCGHVLSGANIVSSWSNDNEPIIKVGYRANLIVIGSENETQSSQTHTLYGFDEKGDKQSYDNVCGGVITAGQDDDIIGIYMPTDYSTVTLNSTTIFGCVDNEDEGAGVDISGKHTKLYFNNSRIQHCCAYCGGAIHLGSKADSSSIFMSYSLIDNNYAFKYGGGIYSEADGVTIESTAYNVDDESTMSTISNNKTHYGGGICITGDGAKINGIILYKNTATTYGDQELGGGGVYFNGKDNVANNCKLKENNSEYGGGVFIGSDNNTLKGCSFTNNTALDGGGLYLDSEDNMLDDCIFISNTSRQCGSAIYDNDDGNTLKNCTITKNIANLEDNKYYLCGAVYVYGTVDVILEGLVNISNNTNGDVFLDSHTPFLVTYSRAHIKINPSKFDINSKVGICMENPSSYAICVESFNGNIPIDKIKCFYVDKYYIYGDYQSNKYRIDYAEDDHEKLAFIEK